MRQPHIVQAFAPVARAKDPTEGEITVRLNTLPDALRAPTGRIVACDPFYCSITAPLTIAIPPGAYPVILCLARLDATGEERIAAAMLQVEPNPVAHWELAISQDGPERSLPPIGADPSDDEQSSDYTYGVDFGVGSYMDQAAVDAVFSGVERSRTGDGSADEEAVADFLWQRMDEAGPRDHPERYSIVVDEQSGVNMLIFASGWGDGGYAAYWGFDGDEKPVCLITDFGIFEDAEWIQ